MYEQYFGLRESPFRITPDPRFLYRNTSVEEAVAALAYGIERRKGFLSLVGEAGTGKTTLLRHVLNTLSGNVRTVLLLHPTVEFDEILEYILAELGIPREGGRKLVLLQRLQEFLLAHTRAGGNVALLIDEAQDLEPRVLEELRLLSNLETGTEKIFQIVLAGQPELERKLADPSLRQLRQRIALHLRLRPLSPSEVIAYIATRLQFAGASRGDLFAPAAMVRIASVTQGIPRLINVLCDACLVTAFATGAREVTTAIVDESWTDYARLAVDEPEVLRHLGTPAAAAPPPPAVTSGAVHVEPPTPLPLPVEPPPTVAPGPASSHQPPASADAGPAPLDPIVINLGGKVRWYHIPTGNVAVGLAAALATGVGIYLLRTRPVDTTHPTPFATAYERTTGGSVVAPSSPEALALVHAFMLAYEARDLDGLMTLFAPHAVADGRQGRDAIRAEYARTFSRLADVTYTVPRVTMTAGGERVTLSGPVRIDYRQRAGSTGALRGTTEWDIARAGGTARIVGLRSEFGAAS